MKTDMRTDVLAEHYTSYGVMQLTKFSEVNYNEFYSISSQFPSYAPSQKKTKYVIGVGYRDGFYMDDFMIDVYPGKKISNEPWRKNIFHVQVNRDNMISKDVQKLLLDYRVYFEDDHVELMTAWIDDRVDHEVKEYRKFWNIK